MEPSIHQEWLLDRAMVPRIPTLPNTILENANYLIVQRVIEVFSRLNQTIDSVHHRFCVD